jgi:hypothetical protein
MNGSLAFRNGVLHVARHARTAEIRTYDMDGGRIGEGFTFAGLDGGAASADGVAVDTDMRIWVADGTSRALRTFTVFGGETSAWRAPPGAEGNALFQPVSVAIQGVEDETRILVASRGDLRGSLQLFDRNATLVQTMRSRGDPLEPFGDLVRVSMRGRFVFACERKSGLIQIFRDGEFHWAFHPPRAREADGPAEPRAVQSLTDGRMLVATGGEEGSAVHLLDANANLVRTLATSGTQTGQVFEPTDLALDESDSDRRSRVAVIDHDGDRVQVFTLTGVCYGSFADLPRATA